MGKSLCVPSQIHIMARNAASPGRMVRPLLRQAFSRRKLIESSYAGQKRKRADGTDSSKPSLKKYQKMADIHGMTLVFIPSLNVNLYS